MTRKNTLTLTALSTLAAVVLLVTSLAWPSEDPTDPQPGKAQAASPRRTPADPSTATITPPSASTTVEALLPFTHRQIADAAGLAARFTAAYTTHPHQENPRQYLRRLAPMTAPHLHPLLEQAAGRGHRQAEGKAAGKVAVGHASTTGIRTLGPSSIIFLTTAQITTHTPGQQQRKRDLEHFAVTTLRHNDGGGGWVVYAVELAATGDWGESGDPP